MTSNQSLGQRIHFVRGVDEVKILDHIQSLSRRLRVSIRTLIENEL